MTRTFSREHWDAAQQAWRDGEFSGEWRQYRHQAAMRGMIYPPEGTRWDSWEDDEPSERAIIIRAIRETPVLTADAIGHSRSWAEVVARVVRRRDAWRVDLEEATRHHVDEQPTHRESVSALKSILQRIWNS